MNTGTAVLALVLAVSVSACCCEMGSPDAIASVSQDARLSLALGAAPGEEGGIIYDWGKREREERRIAASHCRHGAADPKCSANARPAGPAG